MSPLRFSRFFPARGHREPSKSARPLANLAFLDILTNSLPFHMLSLFLERSPGLIIFRTLSDTPVRQPRKFYIKYAPIEMISQPRGPQGTNRVSICAEFK
jgi:hypothetical protein